MEVQWTGTTPMLAAKSRFGKMMTAIAEWMIDAGHTMRKSAQMGETEAQLAGVQGQSF